MKNSSTIQSTPIAEIMTKKVTCVSPHQEIAAVKRIYEEKEFHHHIPVTEDGVLVGMVSLVDFMYHIKGAGLSNNQPIYQELKVKDIMSVHPHSITVDASIGEVAEVLARGDFRGLPVVDRLGKVVGIVTTADVIRYFLGKVEVL